MGTIHHLHWQAKVQPGPDPAWGQLVTDIEDIRQCHRIIILTPRLSVPTAPQLFCDALNYIDRPAEMAIPVITQEIWDALDEHEPRSILDRVDARFVKFNHYAVRVAWHLREDVAQQIRFTDVELEQAA